MRKYDGKELKKGNIYSNNKGDYLYIGYYGCLYSFKQVDLFDDGDDWLILDNDVRFTDKELWFY